MPTIYFDFLKISWFWFKLADKSIVPKPDFNFSAADQSFIFIWSCRFDTVVRQHYIADRIPSKKGSFYEPINDKAHLPIADSFFIIFFQNENYDDKRRG